MIKLTPKIEAVLQKKTDDYNTGNIENYPVSIHAIAEVMIVQGLIAEGYFKSFSDAYKE